MMGEQNFKENYNIMSYTCTYCMEKIGVEDGIGNHICFENVDFSMYAVQADEKNRIALVEITPRIINTRTEQAGGSKTKKAKIKKVVKGYNFGVVVNKNMGGPLLKCGYCGSLLKCNHDTLEMLPSTHKCFEDFNEESQVFNIDKNMIITMVNMSPPETSVPLSSMDLNDSIIFEVRQRPALYDIINIPVQERTKLKKKDLWREISCCMKNVLTAEEIEDRWNKLRTRYVECRRKEKEYVPSGSAAKKKSIENFPFMKQLSFLDDTVVYAETDCSLKSASRKIEENSESDFRIDLTEEDCKKENERKVVTSFEKSVVNIMNDFEKKPDGVDGFVTIVINKLKELPIANRMAVQVDLLSFTKDIVHAHRNRFYE